MSEGLTQITIPGERKLDDDRPSRTVLIDLTEFEEEDYDFNVTPNPFQRGGFVTPSGQESPTTSHFGEKNGFNAFHARGDSITSEDSNQSFQYNLSRPPAFVHSAHSSVTTANSATKKPSFASFKNPFKSGKSADVPPVPQVYPALRNPFSRSTSSLANPQVHAVRRPSAAASPTPQRPPTPAGHSSESRHMRGPSSNAKLRTHVNGRSQYSVYTDGGSDSLGHGLPRHSTPPPVPRMPDEYGTPVMRVATPTWSEAEEKLGPEPQTPSDYAFHAIFLRFSTMAEALLQEFLRQDLVKSLTLLLLHLFSHS